MPLFFFLLSFFQVPVVHNDPGQSGANTNEAVLTPANVGGGRFGQLCSASITGNSFAQVLYVPGVTVSGNVHDLAIVATMGNDLYAFDAHSCAQLWVTNFGATWTTYGNCCSGNEIFYGLPMGILGTPVVNLATLKLWVINATSIPSHVLNRVDLATGTVEASLTISGSVTGTGGPGDSGNCVSGSTLTFRTVDNMQVSGLALSPDGSKVYFGFGGWENGSVCYHGWVFAYNTSGSMSQAGIFCTSPDGTGGSPWMSRGAPAVDSAGNVYVVSGNGTVDSNDFGQSVLKLTSTLGFQNVFTDPNWSNDNTVDADLASGRFMLVPGTSFGIVAGKDFNVYVLNLSNLTEAQTFQTNSSGTPAAFTGSFGSMFMNGVLYLPLTTGPVYAFSCPAGVCSATPAYVTSATLGSHNGQMSGSANGGSDGIIWQVTSATSSFTSNPNGTLTALKASDGTSLFTASIGKISKFASPTIAAGRVFLVNNSGQMKVFGILPSSQLRGAGSLRGAATLR